MLASSLVALLSQEGQADASLGKVWMACVPPPGAAATRMPGPRCPSLVHSARQVSPILGMITGTLILVLVPATKRGHADQLGGQLKARTSWLRDMRALIRK